MKTNENKDTMVEPHQQRNKTLLLRYIHLFKETSSRFRIQTKTYIDNRINKTTKRVYTF